MKVTHFVMYPLSVKVQRIMLRSRRPAEKVQFVFMESCGFRDEQLRSLMTLVK